MPHVDPEANTPGENGLLTPLQVYIFMENPDQSCPVWPCEGGNRPNMSTISQTFFDLLDILLMTNININSYEIYLHGRKFHTHFLPV